VGKFKSNFKQVDVYPMVKHYMKTLDLYNLFNKYVPSSPDCLIEHAECLCVLVANIIIDNKPFYKIQKWLSKYSDGLNISDNINLKSELFNDDRLARSVSTLYDSDRNSLMTELSCNAITNHKLLTDEIHNDSTSVTFSGQYNNSDSKTLELKHGHNKDFRPDCKQLVFGLNITADGHVPLSFSLHNGNTSDDVTHIPNWNSLRSLLEKEDFIYIADCKLCSNANLKTINENNGLFITIIPQGRAEIKQFKKDLQEDKLKVNWDFAYETNHSRNKDKKIIFKTYEPDNKLEGFRIIWVHSSSKSEDDKKRRIHKINKALVELDELSLKLNKRRLKTKKQIQAAVDKICKKSNDLISVEIKSTRKQVKVRIAPGSKNKVSNFKNTWSFTFELIYEKNIYGIKKAEKCDGLFPLVTNTDFTPKEVLKAYKRQIFLEKRMYTKKSILQVAPVFLKKETRIEAMLFLYFVALMIVSLIERNIRMNMEKQKIEQLPILPQRMNTKKPTWNNIRYFFNDVHSVEISQNNIPVHLEINNVKKLHQLVLKLLEIPDTIYTNLTGEWWLFKYN
jgi:transposase